MGPTAGVDLLVAGSYRNAFERALFGSFASHLAHHAPCETLLVRSAREDASPTAGPVGVG